MPTVPFLPPTAFVAAVSFFDSGCSILGEADAGLITIGELDAGRLKRPL
jgi:hypothetical protein